MLENAQIELYPRVSLKVYSLPECLRDEAPSQADSVWAITLIANYLTLGSPGKDQQSLYRWHYLYGLDIVNAESWTQIEE